MSEVNIDTALVKQGGAKLSGTDEQLIEMSHGCICCTLTENLLSFKKLHLWKAKESLGHIAFRASVLHACSEK